MQATAANTRVLSVTEYSARLARAVRVVGGAVIEGEAQRPKRSSRGLLWFSLTDGNATLFCKVFASELRALENEPMKATSYKSSSSAPTCGRPRASSTCS